jgi:hypothetical protein
MTTALEQRLDNLRRMRVGLRQAIERSSACPLNNVDDRERIRWWRGFLRSTDEEFETLCRLLGKPLPARPIRLR